MRDGDELLDIKQAAALLNVSETSLRRWTNDGLLQCLRVGRRRERRFRRADLMAFMEVQPVANHAGADTGLRAGAARATSHACAVYTADASRTRLAASFLVEGIRANARCWLIARIPAGDAIVNHLRREHGNVVVRKLDAVVKRAEYAATGQAQLAYLEAEFNSAKRAGVKQLRMVGDLWQFATQIPAEKLHEYEAEYDVLARRFGVVTLCLYDARRFDGTALVGALRDHPQVLSQPVQTLLA